MRVTIPHNSFSGEKQALATGERLRELNYPYTSIVHSTMTRAIQTAKLIHKFLPELPVKDDSILEEGAPCIPEPKHSHWKPELYVNIEIFFKFYYCFKDYNKIKY